MRSDLGSGVRKFDSGATRDKDKSNPSHYDQFPDGIQPLDVIMAWGLDFCSGNIVKYIARAGNKSGESKLDDYRKARTYLDRLITREEKK